MNGSNSGWSRLRSTLLPLIPECISRGDSPAGKRLTGAANATNHYRGVCSDGGSSYKPSRFFLASDFSSCSSSFSRSHMTINHSVVSIKNVRAGFPSRLGFRLASALPSAVSHTCRLKSRSGASGITLRWRSLALSSIQPPPFFPSNSSTSAEEKALRSSLLNIIDAALPFQKMTEISRPPLMKTHSVALGWLNDSSGPLSG